MRYLLCRFGGMGDSFALTPVAAELHRRGHTVVFTVMEGQVPVFENLDCFRKVLPTRRLPHPTEGVDCIPMRYGWGQIDAIKPRYDRVIDYKWSIERNSMYSQLPYGPWVTSMNSNFVNWVDLSFAWANIDPRTISPERKLPLYKIEPEEKDWADGVFKNMGRPIIGIHLQASSLSRTWYYPATLASKIMEAYPDYGVMVYQNNTKWKFLYSGSEGELGPLPPRRSFALISRMAAVICVDSAISHVSEAMGIPHITIYTTVPAWTRECYYRHSYTIEPDPMECHPCFNLGRVCPESERIARESITDREKKIEELIGKYQGNLERVAEELDTTPQGIQNEVAGGKQRIEGLKDSVPRCVKTITSDRILARLKEALDAGQHTYSDAGQAETAEGLYNFDHRSCEGEEL